METANEVFKWAQALLARPQASYFITGAAFLTFALMLVSGLVAPFVLQRLPADYFVKEAPTVEKTVASRVLKLVRNLIGGLLFLVGIALLWLPGPGLLTLLLALGLSDLPQKRPLLLWILQRPGLKNSIDRLRLRAGKQPLQF